MYTKYPIRIGDVTKLGPLQFIVHNTEGVGKSMTQLREPLANFAVAMEEKLRKNDHKKGWRELPVEALYDLLEIELREYEVAKKYFEAEAARKELVDIANFCMMIWDRLGQEK